MENEVNNEINVADVVAELQAIQSQNEVLQLQVNEINQGFMELHNGVTFISLFVGGLFLLKVREWILSVVKRGVKNVQ